MCSQCHTHPDFKGPIQLQLPAAQALMLYHAYGNFPSFPFLESWKNSHQKAWLCSLFHLWCVWQRCTFSYTTSLHTHMHKLVKTGSFPTPVTGMKAPVKWAWVGTGRGGSLKCLCGHLFIPTWVYSWPVFVVLCSCVFSYPPVCAHLNDKSLKLEVLFLNLGCTCPPGCCGFAVGQLAVIRASEPTLLRCVISGPGNPQWKSKAGTQEMGVEWGHIPMRQHVLQVGKSQDTYLGIMGMRRILKWEPTGIDGGCITLCEI